MNLNNTVYFAINRENWNFFKSAIPVENTDAYWDRILKDGESICKKYEGTAQGEYCKAIIQATVNEIDKLSKLGCLESFKSKARA